MKDHNQYLYVAGIATGIIMSMVSIITSFQMVKYVNGGGSFLVLVLVSLLVGMATGILIAFLISALNK